MNDWLQYNIYVPTIKDIDYLLIEFISEIIKEDCFKNYYYIRYIDDNGPHVRFRYKCNNSKADDSYKLFKQVFKQKIPKLMSNNNFSKNIINLNNTKYSDKYYIIPSLYTQELDKYDINKSISYTESYFNLNSNTSIYILSNINSQYKYLEACRNILLLLSSLLNKHKIDSFLNTCADYWIISSHQKSVLSKYSLTFTEHLSTYIHKKKEYSNNYINNEIKYLKSITKDFSESQLSDFLFHIIHMMNNRLGIYPIEESLLYISMSKYLKEEMNNE
ncbi:thiopeptide-type bacteriocin biosynthesis protein [Macrococcus equi]|uniref:thiopeptide-type bacteriocin biosynthesis protein n=1 Tax=Macrococcus equi TaxID=3395462 RepID=UPI0039BDF940